MNTRFHYNSIIRVYKFNPLKGGTYVKIPSAISGTNGVVNVQNKDNLCFLYSILAIKHRSTKHPEHVKQYKKYLDELIYDESEFPMKIPRIRFFEQKNNIGINVYGCEEYNPNTSDEMFNRNDVPKFFEEQEVEATEKEIKCNK